MPSSPSTRLRAELQAAGENLNTWGAPKLNAAVQRLEEAIAGRQALTVSAPVTLTATNYVADQARNMFLDCTGTGGTITIPAVEKLYLIRNATSGSIIVTTGSGTTATLTTGAIAWVVSDATNVYSLIPTNGSIASGKLSTGGPTWDGSGNVLATGGLYPFYDGTGVFKIYETGASPNRTRQLVFASGVTLVWDEAAGSVKLQGAGSNSITLTFAGKVDVVAPGGFTVNGVTMNVP